MKNKVRWVVLVVLMAIGFTGGQVRAGERWSEERAAEWKAGHPWLVGCNFIPSTAINQIEMWQAESFDPVTIDRELGWAEGLGFNAVRVFLHDAVWVADGRGMESRMDQFLGMAEKHHIGVLFVIFDGCWDPVSGVGKQRGPRPHTHNSGWVQSPSQEVLKDPVKCDGLEPYVKAVMGRFKDDKRVIGWDLYNEPDNPNTSAYGKVEVSNKAELALSLLKKVFGWARAVGVSQPLTAGVWHGDWSSLEKMPAVGRYCMEESDIVSFHDYSPVGKTKERVAALKALTGRPLWCTEYMARPAGSTFGEVLPYLKEEGIGAFNWGFVNGKSQTIYPWDSWTKAYEAAPPLWFHDIFETDGRPYKEEEVGGIRKLTGKS